MSIIKLAIVGCGAISEASHIPAAVGLLGAENVTLIDNDKERLGLMERKFGVRSTAKSLGEVSGLDALVIAAPPDAHPMIGEEALSMGLDVLCEKPLANTSEECADMVNRFAESGRTLAICHTYRFFPNRYKAHRMVEEGDFGRIKHVVIEQGSPSMWPTTTGYTFRKEMVSGGVLLNEGIHSLDFLFWLFGLPVESDYIDDYLGGLESNASMNMTFKGGTTASFRISRTCSLSNMLYIEGENISVEMDLYEMNKINIIKGDLREESLCGDGGMTFNSVFSDQMKDFIDAIAHGSEPRCTGEDGKAAVDFIGSCYKVKRIKSLPESVPLPGAMW
jgi:predicted dehydrogenase